MRHSEAGKVACGALTGLRGTGMSLRGHYAGVCRAGPWGPFCHLAGVGGPPEMDASTAKQGGAGRRREREAGASRPLDAAAAAARRMLEL